MKKLLDLKMESLITRIDSSDKEFTKVSKTFLLIILILVSVIAFVACSSQKNLSDHSTSTSVSSLDSSSILSDSASIRTITIHDTLYITVTSSSSDSISSSTSNLSDITFLPTGGTYNTKTGEASNVLSVSVSEQTELIRSQLKTTSAQLSSARDSISLLKDSVSQLSSTLSSSTSSSTVNDIEERPSLTKFQQTFIYIGLIFLIVYILRILLKALAIFKPELITLNKILSWLP